MMPMRGRGQAPCGGAASGGFRDLGAAAAVSDRADALWDGWKLVGGGVNASKPELAASGYIFVYAGHSRAVRIAGEVCDEPAHRGAR